MNQLKWRDSQGVRHYLWEMTDGHLKGVMEYLREEYGDRIHDELNASPALWAAAVTAEMLRRQVLKQSPPPNGQRNVPVGPRPMSSFQVQMEAAGRTWPAILDYLMGREARASVNLDKDPEAQTFSEATVPHEVVKVKYGSVRKPRRRTTTKGRSK